MTVNPRDSLVAISCGEELQLVPQLASHADVLYAVLQDDQVYPFLDEDPPADFNAFQARLKRLETRTSPDGNEQWLNWVVFSEGEMAGYVQATVYPDCVADIAYVLNSAFWGKGIASRAVGAMMDHLITHHGVVSLFAEIDPLNVRSIELVKRLGFVQVPHDAEEVKFEKADF